MLQAVSSGSTLFAYVSILVSQAERVDTLLFIYNQIRKKVEQVFEGLQGSIRKKRRESVNEAEEEPQVQPATQGMFIA